MFEDTIVKKFIEALFMNFEFSEDQRLLKDQARKFLSGEESIKKARAVLEGDQKFDEQLWKSIIDMGWTATTIPENYQGLGLGHLELCVIAEELGRSLAPTPFSSSVYLATETINKFGSKNQKETFLPKLASGEIVGTLAHTELTSAPTPNNIQCKFKGNTLSGKKNCRPRWGHCRHCNSIS